MVIKHKSGLKECMVNKMTFLQPLLQYNLSITLQPLLQYNLSITHQNPLTTII